jgi:FkbM family methyltransferase
MKMMLIALIRMGASLPVWCKGGITEKVFRRILFLYNKRYHEDQLVYSNLGIDNKLVVKASVSQAPTHFFFGKPSSYSGEYYTLRLAEKLSTHCAAFVDIGANWGYYSYYMAVHYKKPIFWFEPNPVLYRHVADNLRANQFNQVTGSDVAISDTAGQLTFYIDQTSDLQSSLINPGAGANIKEHVVQAIRFEDWANSINIPGKLLVKVDVENAEWNFIKGAEGAFDKIEYLIMEVLGPARESGFINYMIRDLKVHAYYIDENKIEHVQEEDMRYTKGEYNWLFTSHGPNALQQQLSGSPFTVIA